MPNPIALSAGLYGKLDGHGALTSELGGTARIFEMLAPPEQALPYVIFNWQGGGDENLTPSRMVNEVWTVKGVADTLAKAKLIAEDIDGALHMQTLTVTGWTNFLCRREDSLRYQEVDEAGNPIWNVGALYRIRLGD